MPSRRIVSKKNLSTVTRYLLTASCTGSTQLLEVLQKCADQNALREAWCIALGIAFEISATSMVALLLQVEAAQQELYRKLPEILQEAPYCYRVEAMSPIYQICSKIRLPARWLPYVAGALPTGIIRTLFQQNFNSNDLVQYKTSEGKSCLEMAMLNCHPDVAQFFLQLLPGQYDSGALCASVLRAARLSDYGPVRELLNRRKLAVERQDAVLENTAISLAGYFDLVDVLGPLLEFPYPDDRSVVPLGVQCMDHDSHEGNGRIVNQGMNDYVRTWTAWRKLDPASLRSPLLLIAASPSNNNQACIIRLMMEKGYQCDTPLSCVVLALKSSGSTLSALIESYQDVNAWLSSDYDWFPKISIQLNSRHIGTALQVAILKRRFDMARLLIEKGANVNQRGAKGSPEEKSLEYHSCLQIAARELIGSQQEKAIDLVLGAGADLNAPACYHRGATALQYVVMQGNLSLARRLISMGANIDAPRALLEGRTCLEGAAENGKLDMVQYLLNVGANTEGTGRLQYINAAVLAERERHYVIADVLRTHRTWDSTDEALYEDLSSILARYRYSDFIFVHPEEHPGEDLASIRSWCYDHLVHPNPYGGGLIWPVLDEDLIAQEMLCSEGQEPTSWQEDEPVNWADWIEEGIFD